MTLFTIPATAATGIPALVGLSSCPRSIDIFSRCGGGITDLDICVMDCVHDRSSPGVEWRLSRRLTCASRAPGRTANSAVSQIDPYLQMACQL